MIPRKWKIFRIINWIQLCLFLALILFFAIRLLGIRYTDYTGITILFLLLLLPVGISFLNIQLINKFFPDKNLTGSYARLLTASIVCSFIYLGGLMILLVVLGVEFSSGKLEVGAFERIIYTTLAVVFVMGIYILLTGFGIETFLSRKAYQQMKNMIHDIGAENDQKP